MMRRKTNPTMIGNTEMNLNLNMVSHPTQAMNGIYNQETP